MVLTAQYQQFVDLFCKDKNLPKCKVHINTTFIPETYYGLYFNNTIQLYDIGINFDVLIHELAHHYQTHKRKTDTDHGSSFHGSLNVIANWLTTKG